MVYAELDLTRFQEAVDAKLNALHVSLPSIINRGALVTIIGGKGVRGAMQRTPKAAKDKILAVPVKSVAKIVMVRHRGEKMTRQRVKELIRAEYARRVAASGYTAFVGWNKAAIAFGGTGIGRASGGQGLAYKGYGTPATESDLEAILVNAAPAAGLIGLQPLQDALDDTAEDMIEYAHQKMQEAIDTH